MGKCFFLQVKLAATSCNFTVSKTCAEHFFLSNLSYAWSSKLRGWKGWSRSLVFLRCQERSSWDWWTLPTFWVCNYAPQTRDSCSAQVAAGDGNSSSHIPGSPPSYAFLIKVDWLFECGVPYIIGFNIQTSEWCSCELLEAYSKLLQWEMYELYKEWHFYCCLLGSWLHTHLWGGCRKLELCAWRWRKFFSSLKSDWANHSSTDVSLLRFDYFYNLENR